MTETTQEISPETCNTAELTAEMPAPASATATGSSKPASRFAAAKPVLEKLFELYPHLFGAHFKPLKLGIFQDLLAAHPDAFTRNELKTALGVHTRSTRYLQSVASNQPRCNLSGQAVEPLAPEHVLMAIVELFQRRQARSPEDLKAKLHKQFMQAYAHSGLSRLDYLALVNSEDAALLAVLDEALDAVDQDNARGEAMRQAFASSGKSAAEFAAMLGLDVRQLKLQIEPKARGG